MKRKRKMKRKMKKLNADREKTESEQRENWEQEKKFKFIALISGGNVALISEECVLYNIKILNAFWKSITGKVGGIRIPTINTLQYKRFVRQFFHFKWVKYIRPVVWFKVLARRVQLQQQLVAKMIAGKICSSCHETFAPLQSSCHKNHSMFRMCVGCFRHGSNHYLIPRMHIDAYVVSKQRVCPIPDNYPDDDSDEYDDY